MMLSGKALRRRLSEHLRVKLGPFTNPSGPGYELTEWVRHGGGAARQTTKPGRGGAAAVEIRVAQYFDRAVGLGRRWGLLFGLALGAGFSLVVAVLTWLSLEIFG
jgi:hypothetical protein